MEICPKLTPTQALLLSTAARRADERVIPPYNLRGGARVKILTTLMLRGWIEPADDGHALTDAGYVVAGRKRPALPEDLQPVEPPDALQLLEGIPVRPGTKLAALVVALRRPQGATNLQLMLATGWQPYSVRSAISGLLRQRLGLNVTLKAECRRRAGLPLGLTAAPPVPQEPISAPVAAARVLALKLRPLRCWRLWSGPRRKANARPYFAPKAEQRAGSRVASPEREEVERQKPARGLTQS